MDEAKILEIVQGLTGVSGGAMERFIHEAATEVENRLAQGLTLADLPPELLESALSYIVCGDMVMLPFATCAGGRFKAGIVEVEVDSGFQNAKIAADWWRARGWGLLAEYLQAPMDIDTPFYFNSAEG